MSEKQVRWPGTARVVEPGRALCAVGIGRAARRVGSVEGSACVLAPGMFDDIRAMARLALGVRVIGSTGGPDLDWLEVCGSAELTRDVERDERSVWDE